MSKRSREEQRAGSPKCASGKKDHTRLTAAEAASGTEELTSLLHGARRTGVNGKVSRHSPPSPSREPNGSGSDDVMARRIALIDKWNHIQSVQDDWWAGATDRPAAAEVSGEERLRAGSALQSEWSSYKDSYGSNGLAGGWGRTASRPPAAAAADDASVDPADPDAAESESGGTCTESQVQDPTNIASWAP